MNEHTVTLGEHLADTFAEQFRRAIRVDRRRLHRRRQWVATETMAGDDEVGTGEDHAADADAAAKPP